MCFSAQASFAGAAVVTGAGVAALTMVDRPREIPFAALPLGFGIHQALEGWTWLSLDGDTSARLAGFGAHAWVMFAWALLPIYVPWAVWLIEEDRRRRRIMAVLMAIGGALAVVMAYQALQPEIAVSVVESNLNYQLDLPFPAWVLAFPYVAATCLTPTLSSSRWIRVFGIGNFVAMAAAAFITAKDYSSIWCTFAAFLSLIIVAHYVEEKRSRDRRPADGVHLAGA